MTEVPAELQIEIDKLERKHAENPDGRFFVPLANAYRRAGNTPDAERLLRAGLERHPGYLSARIVLGRCLADRDAIAEAEEEFRYVLSEDPQNVVALRTLGELAAGRGRTDEADRWYRELLSIDPQNEEARRALADLQGAQRLIESAPEAPEGVAPAPSPVAAEALPETIHDEHAADEGPEEVPPEVVTETIAELYARQGLHDRAAAVYRELIRRRGADPALQRRLAEVEQAARADSEEEPEAEVFANARDEIAPAALALEDEEALLTPALDSDHDAFADSFVNGFPELEEDDASEPPAAVPAMTIVGFLSRLATWSPAHSGASASVMTPADAHPLQESTDMAADAVDPAEEVAAAHDAELGTPPADDDLFPWEIPAEGFMPVRGLDGEGVHVEGQVEGAEDAPEAATSDDEELDPFNGEGEDNLESFQDWLRSLKQ